MLVFISLERCGKCHLLVVVTPLSPDSFFEMKPNHGRFDVFKIYITDVQKNLLERNYKIRIKILLDRVFGGSAEDVT